MQHLCVLSLVPAVAPGVPVVRSMSCPVRQQLLPSLAVLLASLLLWGLVYTAPATTARRADARAAGQPAPADALSAAAGLMQGRP